MSDITKRLCRPGYDLQKEQAIQEAIIEIRELRAKIEAIPYGAIAKTLTEVMDIAAANGADSRSMPDEYVEVAAWLCGIPGAQPVQSVPEGWKLVPTEPTPKMIEAFLSSLTRWIKEIGEDAEVYKAMLAAAPKPEETK